MGQPVQVSGIVLSTMPIGEFDKRIVILTKERGKIAVFARGVRRQNSPFAAACQPFVTGDFTVYEGRSSYTLQTVFVREYFDSLRIDYHTVCYASYFCEVADAMTVEYNDERGILNLLFHTLRTMTRQKVPLQLIKCIFEMKLLALSGQGMQTFSCVRCGKGDKELHWFDSLSGGVLCESCAGSLSHTDHMTESTLYTLQYIMSSSIEKLYSFLVSDEVMTELVRISQNYFFTHVDKKFKSLEFLNL
ncbi:MAG: DNA repair protein RecO [Lachnospiraceae bacterium]